ncbi:MAG: hypothetical protein AAGA92_11655 [Planctomycetota bacterium]
MILRLALACWVAMACDASADFYTFRVLNRSGRAYTAKAMEFTPDSHKLLFTSGKGTMVLDVGGGRVLYEKPTAAFALGISRDSGMAILVSTRSTQALNLQTGAIARVGWRFDPGYLGLELNEVAGKLILSNFVAGGPLDQTGVPEESELVAVREFGRTNSVLGRGVKNANGLLNGPAGTRIDLTIIPRGKRNPKVFEVVRRRGDLSSGKARFLPERPHREGAPCVVFGSDEYVVLLDAASGDINSILALEETEQIGQRAMSPDGKRLASLGKRREKGKTRYLIETYDVATRQRLAATPFDDSWIQLRYNPTNGDLLVGSHDSVYVVGCKTHQIERQINLGWKPTIRDEAKVDDPDDWWVPQTRARSPKALLNSFDISPQGVLAVAAPSGEVATWSAESGDKLRQFAAPQNVEAEIVRLSPDGKWIAYYGGGELTLETVEPDPED